MRRIEISEESRSNAEKARAAAELGNALKDHGVPHDVAGRVAHHELKHALADKGKPGTFGIEHDGTRVTAAFHETVGDRSLSEKIRIVTAPGVSNMSKKDMTGLLVEVLKAILGEE